MEAKEDLKIAVIGAGVAGITAAYLLQRKYRVVLYEKNGYVGGHTHTVTVSGGPDKGTPVDTGFIVFNNKTYPCFNRFLDQLGVEHGQSDMSFGYHDETTGFEYAGTSLDGLFARRTNMFRPSFWAFIAGIIKFSRQAHEQLEHGRLQGLTLGTFCEKLRLSPNVMARYVLPMASAIWSTPMTGIKDFPMESFARFYKNHGLLSARDRPVWFYVRGGSNSYVKKFLASFEGTVRTNCPVDTVRRAGDKVVVIAGGAAQEYDRVVIAAHADEALRMLADPSGAEKELLGAWTYSRNNVVLHTDQSVMPSSRRAWASWNYRNNRGISPDDPASLTYHMNRLQRIKSRHEYFVTLNAPAKPARELTVSEHIYEHPVYNFDAVNSQSGLRSLNGARNTFFCGSYFRNGFHEDAVASAVDVARMFGIEL